MKKYKISIFGVKETTKIISEYLYQNGIKVDLIVSIDPTVLEKNAIADYTNLEATAKLIGADYYLVKDYTLKQMDDDFFQNNDFELGFVYGWQRVLPAAILAQFSKGIFGFHASPNILPKGRGRSPLNWALIHGQKVLYNHFFKYVTEADAGDLYSVTKFEITPHDTILTLLYKSLFIAKKEITRLIQDMETGKLKLIPQEGEASFFSKRTPEDGLIFFDISSTKDIVNLIRGTTKPFSGAFCFTNFGKKITIWEAWEFDSLMDFSAYSPGVVIDNLYNMPIIKTKDGTIILKNYQGHTLKPNDKLVSK